MGTEGEDGREGANRCLGPPAWAWLEVVSVGRHTTPFHIFPVNSTSCYHRYSINPGQIEENLGSDSLFFNLAPSLYTHYRAAGVSILVRGAVTSGFVSRQ